MQCENTFCIYWLNNECTLNDISLDIQGNCLDCIYIDLDDDVLKKERERMLGKLQEQYQG